MAIRTVADLVLAVACWALATVVIALRLTGIVDWSWWSITAPLWLPFVLVAVGSAAVAAFRRFKSQP